MSTTKKLLVRFDITKKDPFSGDFIIPRFEESKVIARGIKSGKIAEFGMMVYIGTAVTENDLFAKLVDSGTIIANVDCTLVLLRSYLDGLQVLKIGNVVRILPTGDVASPRVDLKLVSNSPSAAIT